MKSRVRPLVLAALCAPFVAAGCVSSPATDPSQPRSVADAAEAATPPMAPAMPAAPAPAAPAAPSAPARELLPASIDFTLANGMQVLLVPDDEVPLVAFEMRFPGGAVEDAPGREGAAALMADLLSRGAGDRDADAFNEACEFVGGMFGAGANPRFVSASAEFLSKDTDLALELLGDVAMRPRLDAKEFEDLRARTVDEVRVSRDDPQSVIPNYWTTFMYGGTPYGRPAGGDERSLAALTHDDVKAAAARVLVPQRCRLAVAGAFDPAEMRKKIEARFGGWAAKGADFPRPAGATAVQGGRVLLVDAPEALQTFFRFGNLGIHWSDRDYAARQIANTVLGGRFTSRLNAVLRTEKGLTYGANSVFDDSRGGMFDIRTYTAVPTSEPTMGLAASIYGKFRAEGLTAEELASAKAYIRGQYAPNTLETAEQRASMLLHLAFDGLPRDLVNGYFARIDGLSLDEVNRVIRERFPKDLAWVVVGPAEHLRPLVAKYGTVTEVKVSDPGWGPSK